jgi:hypothetical protein
VEPRRPVEEGRQGEVGGGVVLRLGVQAHLRLHLVPDLLHIHHFDRPDGCLAEPGASERSVAKP